MRGGPLYRIAQLRRAISVRPGPPALTRARSYLTNEQWRLFAAMSPRDQWHGIETLRLLHVAGWEDEDLAVAALLHDAGKGYIRLHERVLYVLLARPPWLLRRLASARGYAWRAALHRSLHHAEDGARLALRAGASARAAQLIATHHRPLLGDAPALALADADDRA